MNLTTYQITLSPSEPGFLARVGQEIGSWPLPGKILGGAVVAIAAVVAAPFEAGALVVGGAGAVAAGGIALADHLINGHDGLQPIAVTSKADLNRLQPFSGQGSLKNGYYIEHPQCRSLLVPASTFHSLIEEEQVQEIIRFVRSKVKAKSLRVVHRQTIAGSAGARARVVDASAKAGRNRKVLANFTYDQPTRAKLDRPLIWKHVYQELSDGLASASGGGTAKYVLSHTGGFSIEASLASKIGANLEYLNNRHIEVEVVHV